MSSKSKVYFFSPVGRFSLENRNKLKGFIGRLFQSEKRVADKINYIFCDDRAIRKINKQYLKHDYATDIITFDLSDDHKIVADIYISIDRVIDNAKTLNLPFKSEIHRVILHGALHLCGYKDKTPSEIKKMRGKEDFYLRKYGISPL